jgi:hypothetical protein
MSLAGSGEAQWFLEITWPGLCIFHVRFYKNPKWGWECSSVVQRVPSMCETWGSISGTMKKRM